jgi:hypothetical protein
VRDELLLLQERITAKSVPVEVTAFRDEEKADFS